METIYSTNSVQQVFEDCDMDSFKEKDPFAMKGWHALNEKNLPRNILNKFSDLMPTRDFDGGHAQINRMSWRNNLEAIEREYERTGSIGRHDLVCLLDFVDEANNIIDKMKNPDEMSALSAQEFCSLSDRVEDLERDIQHRASVMEDMTSANNAMKNKLDKAAEFAAYALHLDQDLATRTAIGGWLIKNGYKQLVPGTSAYERRLDEHARNVAELQEARDRAQVAESVNAVSVTDSAKSDSVKSEVSKIINQIKEEEDNDNMPF